MRRFLKQSIQAFRLFVYSQHAADGLRITFSVLAPALFGSYVHSLQLGMLCSLGALCVSLADTPGAIINRANTMLFCIAFVFVTALVTELARQHPYILGATVFALCFFYSMFLVYGPRGAAVGNAALLVLILNMDPDALPLGFGLQSLLILIGGTFYACVSLAAHRLAPLRPSERSLGESIRELGAFLRIKASFYDPEKSLEATYEKLIAQQVVINEKQDAVREVLFKTKQVTQNKHAGGNKLLSVFIETVDLFEEITATYQDYQTLHARFGTTGILPQIAALARSLAHDLEAVGFAIQASKAFTRPADKGPELEKIRLQIDLLQNKGVSHTLVLQKLLANIRSISFRIDKIHQIYAVKQATGLGHLPLEKFVGHQSLSPGLLTQNMNMQSAVFRHSLRVAIAALAGFVLSKSLAEGHYSYWILMTIIFMLKPSFSLTRQRNVERIAGTVSGGIIGILLLFTIESKQVLFGIMLFLMLGTYSFMRTRYLLSVVLMTPFLLILFSFLGVGVVNLLQERVIDTLLGCLIALLAGYLLFPSWEREQLSRHLRDMLKANCNYLFRLAEMLDGKKVSITDYKIARKEVYVSSANLAALLQRMSSEPKGKQANKSALQRFVILNHILFSNTATLAGPLVQKEVKTYPAHLVHQARQVLLQLCQVLQEMNTACSAAALATLGAASASKEQLLTSEENLISDQLQFMLLLGNKIEASARETNLTN